MRRKKSVGIKKEKNENDLEVENAPVVERDLVAESVPEAASVPEAERDPEVESDPEVEIENDDPETDPARDRKSRNAPRDQE